MQTTIHLGTYSDIRPQLSHVSDSVTDASQVVASLLSREPDGACCGIAICNATPYSLSQPKSYIYSGTINSFPLIILNGDTGVVLARKAPLSLRGTTGVITYKMDSVCDCYLQVMWSVPSTMLFQSSWANVTCGTSSASKKLLWEMYNGNQGHLILAADTRTVTYWGNFYTEVTVNKGSKLELIIDFNQCPLV